MKKLLVVFAIGLIMGGQLLAQSVVDVGEESRGFLFELGIGGASAVYPEPLNSDLNTLAADPTINRIGLDLHLALGYSVTPNGYVTVGAYAIGDRLQDTAGGFFQINTYLYGPGYRIYPFDTGLVIGADLGTARMVVQNSGGGTAISPWGFGWRAFAAYDFDSTRTGFTALVGIGLGSASIDGESVGHAELFVSGVWK